MRFFQISTPVKSRATSLIHKIQWQLFCSKKSSHCKSLYRKISPIGDPYMSVTPVLDGWASEVKYVEKGDLQRVINELQYYKRHKHALEVSLWMTNKRHFPLSSFDAAVRLKLVFKVYGLEKVEDYFNKIPENKKNYSVYLALLNCYTMAKSVDKAESIMQEARDMGYASEPIWYNLMMDLYYQLGNMEKLGGLLKEMEVKGIRRDQFTVSICLRVYASASDAKGMDKVVAGMESDSSDITVWRTYVTAIRGYTRMGLNDRALPLLNKLEAEIESPRDKNIVLTILLNLYTEIGKKDDVYRIWNLFKLTNTIWNKAYLSMIRSLMKLNDVEGAERIFEEWESSGLSFDFRIPNILVDAYCSNNHLEKAETLIAKGISKGGSPVMMTWVFLAGGYLKNNRVPESVEALKKAISVCPGKYISRKNQLTTCLDFLETRAYMQKEEEFTKCIRTKGISLESIFDKLFDFAEDVLLLQIGTATERV